MLSKAARLLASLKVAIPLLVVLTGVTIVISLYPTPELFASKWYLGLLGLLGLSQTIYIGGKAVGAPTIGDLNDKLTQLRQLETTFLSEVSKAWKEKAPRTADLAAAIQAAPDAYNLYVTAAKQAAVMVQERIGAPTPPSNLEPETPII